MKRTPSTHPRGAPPSPTKPADGQLTFEQALASPCETCDPSPCCSHLPLHSFQITNVAELDHAIYLLSFERIELGLSASGEWSAYYLCPCRFLDPADYSCVLHGTPEQPQICAQYNPYTCWYKRALTQGISDNFLRIDRQRLERIRPLITFDEGRSITDVPDWETIVREIEALPLAPTTYPDGPPPPDPAFEAWYGMVARLSAEEVQSQSGIAVDQRTYAAAPDPCTECLAYCCQTLVFPKIPPTSKTNLDYYKFCLGFPGVELGIADDGWQLIVRTTCRFLEGNRCSLYGKPERPLLCRYYDAWQCVYRINFGMPRPPGLVRIRLEQFDWLVEGFTFDQFGAIVEFPTAEYVRRHVESRWREKLPEPTPS